MVQRVRRPLEKLSMKIMIRMLKRRQGLQGTKMMQALTK